MLWIDLALRWAHILGAVTLVGGAIFWRFALLEASKSIADTSRDEFARQLRSRWSKVVMGSSALLLVTGLVNFMLVLQRFEFDKSAFPGDKYHMLFGIKFLLSLAVFMLSALLAGRTGAAESLRRNERKWLTINVILAVIVVCLGGLLRAAARHPKSTQSLQSDRTANPLVAVEPGTLISKSDGE